MKTILSALTLTVVLLGCLTPMDKIGNTMNDSIAVDSSVITFDTILPEVKLGKCDSVK